MRGGYVGELDIFVGHPAKRSFAFFVSAGGRLGSKVNLTVPVVFTLISL